MPVKKLFYTLSVFILCHAAQHVELYAVYRLFYLVSFGILCFFMSIDFCLFILVNIWSVLCVGCFMTFAEPCQSWANMAGIYHVPKFRNCYVFVV